MQLVDSKLYMANMTALDVPSFGVATLGAGRRRPAGGRPDVRKHRNLASLLEGTSASTRLLALMVAAFVVAASPALLATVRSTVSLSLQILLQAGHFGLVAFQIFGR
jgi:hypothetical protein